MRRGFDLLFRVDWALLVASSALTALGLVALYGIGVSRADQELFSFTKQLIAAVIGLVIVVASLFVDYRQIRSFVLPIYGLGIVLLTSVLLMGKTIRGTRGWFVVGRLSFQPVEVAKVFLAIYLAAYLARHVHKRMSWTALAGSALATGVYVFLVMLQPDFGSAVVMIAMWGAAVLFAGLPRRAFLILTLVGMLGAVGLWFGGLKPYQRARLVAFVDPAADPRGSGYNVRQARIAIGSGGWLGKGIAEGSQSRLRFLPEASTDFVFSVIGEELGFVGIVFMLSLFTLLIFRYIAIARASPDPFAQVLLVILLSLFLFHLLVNAGMNLGMMPVTGIPLPFVSAASSSLIVAFVSVALAQSIAVRNEESAFREVSD